MTTASPISHFESFPDFLRRLWCGKFWILSGAGIGLLLAVSLLLTLCPHYEAHMIVGPSTLQGESESISRFENGRDTSGRSFISDTSVPVEFVHFEQIIREQSVSRILSRYKDVLDNLGKDLWFSFQEPEALQEKEVAEYLLKHIKISPIGTTSSRRITYAHPDPAFAALLLGHLHKIADESIRRKAGLEIQERISWLQKELGQTLNPDHRQALASLLLAQERRRMLVSMDQPYAADIIENPRVSAKPVKPIRSLVVLVCVLIGSFFGFTFFNLRRS